MSKQKQTRELANKLRFDIQNLQGKLGYQDRKCPVWGIVDKDTQRVIAMYSNWDSIIKFLKSKIN
ncbi:MAG: hypothetical protein KME29_31350 [Calothrix sp. FI2-JRJ7]|jgi:hypothetical protein|nr:hypothetical protein [Calothrix sp. FI2-JRJ7]